uniref:DDE_3 domain-containing protein n=1 Tax=Rhabditophanes sp. KR3021 TaxID=114890 RepID=A0AC35TPM9_9BILA
MKDRRAKIISLFVKNIPNKDIASSLNINKSTVSRTIKAFKLNGQIQDIKQTGRPRTVATPRLKNLIKSRLKRNGKQSLRKVAKSLKVHRETVRKIVKKDLKLKPYKLQKVQKLDEKNRATRLERCKILKKRFSKISKLKIVWTDEKLFTIEQAFNKQNDRIWAEKIEDNNRYVERRQKPKSVMVWAGVCGLAKTPLIFIEEGVKVNKEVYTNDILDKVVTPWARQVFGKDYWMFQQDSAPSHKSHLAQNYCRDNFPDFIALEEWPPYSPDLNPMDYSIWSILETKACAKPHANLASLKKALKKAWHDLPMKIVKKTCMSITGRLDRCIETEGGIFEK